ncbi:hypothetical protein [Bosea massiliensis]|uniref:J domain-containing protein n=1 Tax=Bosea massiliensis TaxID=151419 RepID=A0ABW0P2G7_9HYPH
MFAEMRGVEEVKRARRAAVRSVEMIRDGSLAEQEVDFARMLFGETAAEEKLAAFGLLDDGGILDNLVRRVETMILFEYQRHRPVAALAEQIEQRFIELQRVRDEKAQRGEVALPAGMPRHAPRPERRDVAERNARTSRSANARLLAVHLAQRALYEGLNLALAELVRRQAAGETPRTLKDSEEMRACLGHGPLAMGPDHVASAEVAINRLRKAHMAGHPERGEVPYLVMVGLADAAPSPDDPDPELAKAVGIAAE